MTKIYPYVDAQYESWCPKCGVGKGEPCVYPSGRKHPLVHEDRMKLYNKHNRHRTRRSYQPPAPQRHIPDYLYDDPDQYDMGLTQ